MADTRINALTTSTVSVTDDFLPIDGATAGTKKLSAYSPSFGGNATVGGTLTVNGANSTLSASSGYAISKIYGPVGGYTDFYAANGTTRNGSVGCEAAGEMYLGTRVNQPVYTLINGSVVATQTSGTLTLAPTTASTSTSSGALVVGNGTSGGLGVGGAIYAGGNLIVSGNIASVGASGSGTGGGVRLVDDGGTTRWLAGLLGTAGARDYVIYDSVTPRQVIGISATSGVVSLSGTTASTSTSTGALVVSGGLGVGGSVNVGGTLTVSGTSSLLTVANSTGSALLAAFSSAYASGSATPYVVIGSFSDPAASGARIAVSTDYSLDNRAAIQLQTRTTAGTLQTALTLANTGNATFLGSVTTGAPSGGTAAAWKLGTVATVSPTSPNRTIEVDIGGTIYYIHAKTTNN
jgi:hypothetical protein